MVKRVNRTNLQPNKSYIKVTVDNGVTTETPVGLFVKSYRKECEEGMALHCEFNVDGNTVIEKEEPRGSVSETQLIWFKEAPVPAHTDSTCDSSCDPSSCSCK